MDKVSQKSGFKVWAQIVAIALVIAIGLGGSGARISRRVNSAELVGATTKG